MLHQGRGAQDPRDLHEDARDVARRKMKTKAFARSRDERKRVEMHFAHLKTHHGFERLRLRGLSGARDEFHLAAIVQNPRRSPCVWSGHRQTSQSRPSRERRCRCGVLQRRMLSAKPRPGADEEQDVPHLRLAVQRGGQIGRAAHFIDSIGTKRTL